MPTPDHLLLDLQLCFALYAATNAVTRSYRAPLGKLGLTYPQYLTLLALWERGGHTVKSLAAALRLDSSTLTPLLKRLELAGWVERRRDPADERVVRIELTAAGKALRRPVAAVQKAVACRTGLRQAEIATLRRQLQTLTETMREAAEAEALARDGSIRSLLDSRTLPVHHRRRVP